MSGLAEAKQRARVQWSLDPCGAEYAREHELGTREFFERIEQHRYEEYAPWMPGVMGFQQFEGSDLLEIGCGMGSDLVQFARGGAHCTAVDLTPRSIEIARHRFALNGLTGTFMVSDCECLPFVPESFDVVYANGVLHHTPDTPAAVSEVHRVLRKGGVAKIMLYHRNSLNYLIEIVLRRGVLRGDFLRGKSAAEIMSAAIEHTEHEAQPLVKVYSRQEALELFNRFKEVAINVEQLERRELRFLAPFIPSRLLDRLQHLIGWNIVITATK